MFVCFSLSTLCMSLLNQIEKHFVDLRHVRLTFEPSARPVPLDLVFPTYTDREIFVQKVFTARELVNSDAIQVKQETKSSRLFVCLFVRLFVSFA